jgi:hypothetical protein
LAPPGPTCLPPPLLDCPPPPPPTSNTQHQHKHIITPHPTPCCRLLLPAGAYGGPAARAGRPRSGHVLPQVRPPTPLPLLPLIPLPSSAAGAPGSSPGCLLSLLQQQPPAPPGRIPGRRFMLLSVRCSVIWGIVADICVFHDLPDNLRWVGGWAGSQCGWEGKGLACCRAGCCGACLLLEGWGVPGAGRVFVRGHRVYSKEEQRQRGKASCGRVAANERSGGGQPNL